MRVHAGRLVAWTLCGLSVALAGVGAVLNYTGHPSAADLDYEVPFFVIFLIFTVVGALIALRRPENPIGWLLLAHGLLWELAGVLAGYANYSLFAKAGSLPGGTFAAWILSWVWIPTLGLIPFLFLLFPDGRLSSRRWRIIVWFAALGVVLGVTARALTPGPMSNAASITNPYGLVGGRRFLQAIDASGVLSIALAIVASITSLILRFRRAGGTERPQFKWLVYAGGLVLAGFTLGNVLAVLGLSGIGDNIRGASLLAIPLAMAITILRYRLYDIDVVISKTVVLGGLASFITAVYLALVVGIGTAVGRGLGSNLALAIVATALVAVAFQPLRDRLQRVAGRLVFGRPTPAEERAGVAINSLGAFRVVREGGMVPPTAWQSKKARSLLKILWPDAAVRPLGTS